MSLHSTLSCLSPFNHPSTTELYTLSLHDALPISQQRRWAKGVLQVWFKLYRRIWYADLPLRVKLEMFFRLTGNISYQIGRAHVELQSHSDLVCRLLLEKKKQHNTDANIHYNCKYL